MSGKGGAGKTVVTAALASIVSDAVFCDNDVDAPDLHLILHPEIRESHLFESSYVASIHAELCTNCGICAHYCRFNAIHLTQEGIYTIDPYRCEGCRLCERICPEKAITSQKNRNNSWFVSDTRFGPLVHASMGPGEENSGKLVTRIRKKARELAEEYKAAFILSDGPPGIGCPAIASITGTNVVVVVIEPSLSGLQDARRLIELANSFKIPMYAIINKSDLNLRITKKVKEYLKAEKIPLLGELHFSENVVKSVVNGKAIPEFMPKSRMSRQFYSIRDQLMKNE